MMQTSLKVESIKGIMSQLRDANEGLARLYPGERAERQPVHTVYGGAHLFKSDSVKRLGELALRAFEQYAPTPAVMAEAFGLDGADIDIDALYQRVKDKLRREAVEDFRIDFEDGYGNRPDEEEDACAEAAAREISVGMKYGTLPPFLGIRIKPLNKELHRRGIRTMDIVLTELLNASGGQLPEHFVVTLPKVMSPAQVSSACAMLSAIEYELGLFDGAIAIELMIETTQSILGADGACAIPALVAAARGRCVAAHFGVYDYTASCSITAQHQNMTHPACDFARHMMQVALGGTGIWLSDGATNIMPIPQHRESKNGPPLTAQQKVENQRTVHRAWRRHYDDVRHSLQHAYYQGWDLNPAQLPSRYVAVFCFFQESLASASERLRKFMAKAAQATVVGDIFDDAATGQGLLNFFLRGLNCGAISEAEANNTGLTLDELRSRSFVKILEQRRAKSSGRK